MKVAINGFGRIGRHCLRLGLESKKLQFIAVNDPSPLESLVHLLKYDSLHRRFEGAVSVKGKTVCVDGQKMEFSNESDPTQLNWKKLGVDLVLECSGRFRTGAGIHLKQGARKVLISSPAKNIDMTLVMGINEKEYDPQKHHVLSTASCTTNCLGIVAKVLREAFGIERAFMTTIHSYTSDQRLIDNAHKDLRRARAAPLSMIPTTSGATEALFHVFPELKGAFKGLSIRVPTPDVSLVDLVAVLKKDVTEESVNHAFKKASKGSYGRYLSYCEEPLVSSDFIGDRHSAIIDASLTQVMGQRFVKVIAWYDNEIGFSQRMIDLAELL